MSKEKEVVLEGRYTAEEPRRIAENLSPATANKAAEEGELPALPEVAHSRLAPDFTAEQMRAYARQAIAADRASRQVANKAEVDLSMQQVADVIGASNLMRPAEFRRFLNGDDVVMTATQVWKMCRAFATPPATTDASTAPTDEELLSVMDPPRAALKVEDWDPVTKRPKVKSFGASTVLTDERIYKIAEGNWDTIAFARAIESEIKSAAAASFATQAGQVAVPGWVSVDERLPDAGHCLATYRNQHGKLRIIRAKYARQFEIDAGEDAIDQGNCEYNEADDTFYLKAGWLECIDNWDDYSSIYVTEGEVTHWMPLPAAPSPAKESK